MTMIVEKAVDDTSETFELGINIRAMVIARSE